MDFKKSKIKNKMGNLIKNIVNKKLTNIRLHSKKNIYKTDIILLESGFEIDYFI
jgi:hypothetical protein